MVVLFDTSNMVVDCPVVVLFQISNLENSLPELKIKRDRKIKQVSTGCLCVCVSVCV